MAAPKPIASPIAGVPASNLGQSNNKIHVTDGMQQ